MPHIVQSATQLPRPMDEDLVYVRCGGCHARFKNASLVAAHQAKRVGSKTRSSKAARAASRDKAGPVPWTSRGLPCRGASTEQVRVYRCHPRQATRTAITVIRPGAADAQPQAAPAVQQPGQNARDDDLGHDIDEHLADASAVRATAEIRVARDVQHVFAGGAAPSGIGARGVWVQDPQEDDLSERPSHCPAPDLTPTEAGFLQFTSRFKLTDQAADGLLKWVQAEQFQSADLRFSTTAGYKALTLPLAAHGIHCSDLSQPAIDGDNTCRFWYRTAVDIVVDMLQDPALAPFIDYEYRPEFDPSSGERVYSSINNSCMLEAMYVKYEHLDCVIVPVLVASDATCVEKRRAEHPAYVSCGLLSEEARGCDAAWRLAGNVPQYQDEAMTPGPGGTARSKEEVFRRRRRLLQDTLAHIMTGMCDSSGDDVRVLIVKCSDGNTRRILPVLGAFSTDREEHTVSTATRRGRVGCNPLCSLLSI